ncbi:hypothetical protein O5D80_003234 [Batrachochytrium dendrobatidis]|nr:hypothetical protein O5D80_003234 [Batrachochytrium dendrobatidis]
MKFTGILFLLSAAVTANAMLVSTGSNGSPGASGLIAGFSSNIYKRGQQQPADKDQSDTDSDQEAASGENGELIRQLKIQVEDAGKAESIAANTLLKYTNLGFKQKKLIAQGKTISGEKYSKQREDQLDEEWKAQREKLDILRQKLREARLGTSGRDRKHSIDESDSSTSSRDRKHSIDKPDPSTPSRDRKHSIVRHHSDTDSDQGITSGKNSELIRRLEREVEDAENAEAIASSNLFKYTNLGVQQKGLIAQGKAISGEKYSKQRQDQLKKEWEDVEKRLNLLRQKLQEARLGTPSRDRKHSIDKPDPSTPSRDRKHSIDDPGSRTSSRDRKHSIVRHHSDTDSDQKTAPGENSELIRRLEKELEDAEKARVIAHNSYYEYRNFGFEQKRLIAHGKVISGEKHSKQRQDQLDKELEAAKKRLNFLKQKLQQARLGTPSRDRKHSIVRHHSDTDSDQGTTSGENRELIRRLEREVEDADTARVAACDSYYGYVFGKSMKMMESQGEMTSEQKLDPNVEQELKGRCEDARRIKNLKMKQLEKAMLGTSGRDRKHSIVDPGSRTSSRSRKHSIVRHHLDTDSDQGIAPAKKHRPTHQLDINLENAERARAAACNSYYEYKATRLEQKKLKSNGQEISGKKYSSRTEHELKEKCRKASKAKHYMIRQLEGTNGNTPSRSRKHSVVRHHSDTDSDQETLSRKKYRKLVRKLKRKIKEYKRRRKGACKKYRKHQFFVSKQWSRLAKGKSVLKSFYSLKGEEKWKRRCERQGRRVEYLEQKLRELMGEPDSDSN